MPRFDFNGLKERIQTTFETANTTTASTFLSDGLDTKVIGITKKNPDMVFTQATKHPSVHIYPDNKDISQADIAINQKIAKRAGTITMNIMGIYQSFNLDDNDEDKAQKNVEILMENIEQVLRDDPTLGSLSGVRWQIPTGTQYGLAGFDEDVYFRVGVLTLQIKIFY